jgi:hypothetical protein
MRIIALLSIAILSASMLAASPFKVDGVIIHYDTKTDEEADGIEFGHEEELLKLLKKHPEIESIELNSSGGTISAAADMSALIIDANLDTHVEFKCTSACVTIFLGGRNRTLALGGKLGFHKSYWEADSIKEYYESQKEDEGWGNPFEFASWLFEDTQAEIFMEFEYLLERDVSPRFAIETLKAGADGMWYPRRKQLLEGGILTQ